MNSQSDYWSDAASRYEEEFIDPYHLQSSSPLLLALAKIDGTGKVVADLGCGIGPLLPILADQFLLVHAVDFAPGMLERARQRCANRSNVLFHQCRFSDLSSILREIDVAVAVNSLVQPELAELETGLRQIRSILKPDGQFLGILPAIDAVHYHTMLLVDRARHRGMPEAQARQNAAMLGEHSLYDFAFGSFSYLGLEQHFWQPFEIPYRLERCGFRLLHLCKAELSWSQFAAGADLREHPPPWDWFFLAEPVGTSSLSPFGPS